MPFDEQLAFSDRARIESHQWTRFQQMIDEIIGKNEFWTKRFSEAGITPDSLRSRENFRQIPILEKKQLLEDQEQHGPYGTNLTYPLKSYSRLHQTSGTTGNPLCVLDTPASWSWFMDCWEQIYSFVGVEETDRIVFPFSFGPFIGFWAAFDASHKLGYLSLPGGGMSSLARINFLMNHSATYVCCTPTYALRLLEVAENEGIELKKSSIRGLIVAGEPGGNIPAVKERIETGWGATLFDHWGMTEIGALGIECKETPGTVTILESECIAEILNPETFEPVTPGETGELVITNLGRWGSPLIRYRTGDMVVEETTPCPVGRTFLRLAGGILSRSDDMILIRGNNVYPSSIEAILREFDEVVEFQVSIETVQSMSQLKIQVEPKPGLSKEDTENLIKNISIRIKDRLNFHAEIVSVPPESLPRFELKGRRFHRQTDSE